MGKALLKIFKGIFFTIFFSLSCFPAYTAEETLKKACFIAQWIPQAQFAGYYVAYEKGIYKKYGIDLQIITGGPLRSPAAFLKDGQADFINMGLNSGIQARATGLKLVNIAQIVQKSACMLVAKKSSGIENIGDINNKKVGVWAGISQIQTLSFIKKYNLKVKVVPQTYSVNLFLRDGIDVASAMWYNEYHTILNAGYNPEELTTFFFSEHDLNFPEDGIYTLQERLQSDPDLCYAFVRASIAGWRYAFEHPEEALDVVLKYAKAAHISANRTHQKWMLERIKDLTLVEGIDEIQGRLSSEDYYRVAEELKKAGTIEKIPEFNDFYRDCASDDQQ